MLLAIVNNEGFNHIFSHFVHLKYELLFLCPIKSHSDLIFSQFMHALHSSLLISDKLSTGSDNEADVNLKLSIKLSFTINTFSFNWYKKSDVFFYIFSYKIKFIFKFFCLLIYYRVSIITTIMNYYWYIFWNFIS